MWYCKGCFISPYSVCYDCYEELDLCLNCVAGREICLNCVDDENRLYSGDLLRFLEFVKKNEKFFKNNCELEV